MTAAAAASTTVLPAQLVLTKGTQWFEWERQAKRFANSLDCLEYLPSREDVQVEYDPKKDPVKQLTVPTMPAAGTTATSADMILLQIQRADYKEGKANAAKLKTFLLDTLCQQYKYQVDTEINNDQATPMEIFRYIHTNWCPSNRVLEQLLEDECVVEPHSC
jgi:hypothetical protein